MEVAAGRTLSPGAYPAPWWGPQREGPASAKRRRVEEPAGPDSGTAPSLQDPAGPPAAGTLTSVVVLAPGCALQLPLDDVDLVLEPEPTSVLQVALGGHTLMLVPQALLEPGVLQGAPGEDVAVHQGFSPACVPEIAAPKGAYAQDADPEFLPPWGDAGAGSLARFHPYPHSPISESSPQAATPSPLRRSPGPYVNLDFHLLEPFPAHRSNLYLPLRVQVRTCDPSALRVPRARPGDACSRNELPHHALPPGPGTSDLPRLPIST